MSQVQIAPHSSVVPDDAATPMRICHVIPQIGIGGAETQLHALITHSDPAVVCHEVLYYSDSLDDECYRLYESGGIRFSRVPRNKKRPLAFVRRLAAAIRERRPDLVHCWLFSGILWGRLGAMWAGAPRILLSHRAIELAGVPLLRLLERLTSGRVHYAANSRACAEAVSEQLGLCAQRFHIVYNGIDCDRFPPGRDDAVRRELNVPDGVKLVVSVGRLTEAKNHPMLLRVARRARGRLPVHFVIVGHGELREELLEQSGELGVTDTVTFLGLRRDIARILRGADLFAFTSLHEGFPNAVLEAMLAGLPIVTSGFRGVDELIEHGRTGLVVPSDDDAAMCAALERLLGDSEPAVAMGERARQTARERFAMSRMVDETIQLYRCLIAAEK